MENLQSLPRDWQKLDRERLKELLKKIKWVWLLIKDLWRTRWLQEFHKIYSWKSSYLVEYYPSMSMKDVEELSLSIYSKTFNKIVSLDEIIFKKNSELDWWLRIFSDFDMLDLSYKKIESFLLK